MQQKGKHIIAPYQKPVFLLLFDTVADRDPMPALVPTLESEIPTASRGHGN